MADYGCNVLLVNCSKQSWFSFFKTGQRPNVKLLFSAEPDRQDFTSNIKIIQFEMRRQNIFPSAFWFSRPGCFNHILFVLRPHTKRKGIIKTTYLATLRPVVFKCCRFSEGNNVKLAEVKSALARMKDGREMKTPRTLSPVNIEALLDGYSVTRWENLELFNTTLTADHRQV